MTVYCGRRRQSTVIPNKPKEFTVAMTRTILLTIACLISFTVFAQKPVGTLKGKVLDKQNKLVLPSTTATLLNALDSSMIGFTVSNKEGIFEIKNIPAGAYLLNLTFTGYKDLYQPVRFSEGKPLVDLGDILLDTDTSMLAAVVVRVPPIQIKGDTTEFRASAIKTRPNATVEDLLKRIPGMEVDRDGNITSQGKDIPKIYVDGKEFFGNDPKMATRNLTADMVESVQLYDDMSEQARFNKIDDGSRQRTINIKLKKDRRKGIFGRAAAGLGNEDLYEGSFFVNNFNNNFRVSLVGNASNTNRMGMGGMMSMPMGGGKGGRGGGGMAVSGGRGGGRGGAGNTNIWGGGINFSNDWGKTLSLSGSYAVNGSNSKTNSQRQQQTFFANDSSTIENSASNSTNNNSGHNFSMRLDYRIDSMSSINIAPSLNFRQSGNNSMDSSRTRSITKAQTYDAIARRSSRESENDGLGFNNNVTFRHRFRKKGRTLTVGWQSSMNNSDMNGSNETPYYFFNPLGDTTSLTHQRQQNFNKTRSFNNTINTSITESLTDKMLWEFNYAYTNEHNTSDVDVMEYRDISKQYDSVNKSQTNYFENRNQHHKFGTNLKYTLAKGDLQVGGTIQFTTLENMSHRELFGKDSLMVQKFVNFAPNASYNYQIDRQSSIRFNYRGNTRTPNISQLQDVRDESNLLYIREGNPNLKQEFSHDLGLSFNRTNPNTFMYYSVDANAGITRNRIVNSIRLLDGGKQLSRPENINGAFNTSLSGSFSIPLKKTISGKSSPISLQANTRLSYNRDVSLLNGATNFNNNRSASQSVSFNYYKDIFDMAASGRFTYNDASFNVTQATRNRYFNQNYSLDAGCNVLKDLRLESSFDYSINSGRSDGFNQAIPLWDASVAWTFFKKKNGELKVSVVDILNQNSNVDRTVYDNYIVDSYTQILRRYFMVSFMYGFNQFGGRKGGGQNKGMRLGAG